MGYKLERRADDANYNLYFEKQVNKRDGTTAIEYGEKIYGIPLKEALAIIAHRKTQEELEGDVSLKEYLTHYYKNYENCRA